MAQNAHEWLNAPIINLDTTVSTNNDAMQLIDADTAQPGTTIVAAYQSEGRGQRGKSWSAQPGESLMMSLITIPPFPIERQFLFSALVATTIANVLHDLNQAINVRIKWPNDIIVGDKKAGGILIENVIRGHSWLYAVIGFGLNVLQENFPEELPNATSLAIALSEKIPVQDLMQRVRAALIHQIIIPEADEDILYAYNKLLFRKDEVQLFHKNDQEWTGTVKKVLPNGQLEVQLADGALVHYTHGDVLWKY